MSDRTTGALCFLTETSWFGSVCTSEGVKGRRNVPRLFHLLTIPLKRQRVVLVLWTGSSFAPLLPWALPKLAQFVRQDVLWDDA